MQHETRVAFEENMFFEFSVTYMGGNTVMYKAGSIEELRMRIALEVGVLSPCIRLFKRLDYSLVEDSHKITEIFDPAKQPHELCSVNNLEGVKQEVTDWSPQMWVRTSMLHLRYGDPNTAEHAEPLKSADKRFREKMDEWIVGLTNAQRRHRNLDECVEKIKAVIPLGLDINVFGDYAGLTLFHYAAQNGHMGLLYTLLEAGARVDVRDEHGWTPLQCAAFNGTVDAIRALLARGADPSLVTKGGKYPIRFAASDGYVDGVTLFIDAGVGTDDELFELARTPMHIAALEGHAEVIRVLVEAGASLTVRDADGNTPLDLAEDEECRRLLSRDE